VATLRLAVTIADTIEKRIIVEGRRVGESIGSETELLAEFGVSRAVLREAMLLLEARQVASVRRGPGGGLVVRRPEASSVADAAARLLEVEGMTSEHLQEARLAIEMIAIELTVRKLDESAIVRLRGFTAPRRSSTKAEKLDQLRGFHALLGELSGNPVFKLVIGVLVLVAEDFLSTPRSEIPDGEVEQSLSKQRLIVEAICEGDLPIARVRLKDYLDWVLHYAVAPA